MNKLLFIKFSYERTKNLTSNSSNLLRTCEKAPSKSRDVSAEAVANQMSISKWVLVVLL